MLFPRKNIRILISLFTFSAFLSCKKQESVVEVKFEDEITHYLKSQIDKSLETSNEKVESLKLIKTDSLTEFNIAAFTANYSFEKLEQLNKKQNQLGQKIEKAKQLNRLDEIKKEFNKIWDCIKYYQKISDKVYSSKLDSLKTEYYEYKFLLKTTNNLKKDTICFYSTKTKKKELIPAEELINHIIIEKYKIK